MKIFSRSSATFADMTKKTVVITGASSGAGMAMALEFAKHGAKIVLASRNPEALNEVETQCREMGALALSVQTDVTNAYAMKKLASIAAEFGGSIDVWINNAGVLALGEFSETPVEVHEQVIRTNLLGYLNGAYAVMPYFKQQNYGVLINNISVAAWIPVPYGVGYSASKFGLQGFSEALRGELARYRHIHVCDLYPAFLDSPGVQHAANYTSHVLKPAPPVYDPQRVARAAVSLAIKPRKSVTIGSVATLLKMAYALFPGITRIITAKVIETYLRNANETPETSGNLFAPASYGTSIHGGWNSDADAELRNKNIKLSLAVVGVAAGLFLLGKSKLMKHQESE